MKEEISFIVHRYRRGRFDASRGWKRLGIGRSILRTGYSVAATIAGLIVLSATAMVVYRASEPVSQQPAVIEQTASEKIIKIIDFEGTPLPKVVAKIEETYDVKVENLPSDAESLRLSLHYEGTAEDLVETINSILGTRLTVNPK